MTDDIKKGLMGIVVDETTISQVMPEINSLTYRGYKVQDLCEKCSFEEVAYLVLNGELPKSKELQNFIKVERSNRKLSKQILNDIKNSVEITLKDIIKIYGKESIKLIDELIEKNKILLSEEVFDYYKPIIKSYLKINKTRDPYNLAKTPLQKKIIDLFFKENQTEISKSRVKNILNISDSSIKSLIRSNALVEFKKNILRSQDIDKKTDKKIELSKDQKTAYNRIEKEIKNSINK